MIGDCPAAVAERLGKDPVDPLSPSLLTPEEAWSAATHFIRRDIERNRNGLVWLANTLLELGRVRPWLLWEVQPKIVFTGPTLLSYLSLKVCLKLSNADSFAACSYCGGQYVPLDRAPKAGQRNFCYDCRASGVPILLAQRDRRRRLRGGTAPRAGTDEDAGGNISDHEGQAQSTRGESPDQAREYDQNEIGFDAQGL